MMYLVVDGMLSGSGVREATGGYLDLATLGLSDSLRIRFKDWLRRYEDAHYEQFQDDDVVASLDDEGLALCSAVSQECPSAKVEYFSSATMKRLLPTG